MRIVIAAAAFVAAFIATAAHAQSYLCIGDRATGFKYNPSSKKWDQTNFRSDNTKYLLTKKAAGWAISEFGNTVEGVCRQPHPEGIIRCSRGLTEILFSDRTLRYQAVYEIGYVVPPNNEKEGGDTPYIEIGTCSKM